MNKSRKLTKLMILLVVVLAVLLVALFVLVGGSQNAPREEIETVPSNVSDPVATTDPTESEETHISDEFEALEDVNEVEDEEDDLEILPPEVEAPEAGSINYAEYLALTVDEQQAYYENFETPDDFFTWLDIAESEYESESGSTETTYPEDSDLIIEEGELEEWE